jgi:capsular polysaccharide biosynthesis protein
MNRVLTSRVLTSRILTSTVGRPVLAGLLVGLLVLLVTQLRDDEYEARVSLLATPAGEASQFGEVVALSLPAVVEVAQSPSVLAEAARTGTSAEDLAGGVSVELVPASGLARVTVRAASGERAAKAATAIARSVIAANLLAPAGTLRLLDDRPDVTQVAPDRPLGVGLALAVAVLAGIATAALWHVRPGNGVRAALNAAGVHHPVATAKADDPALPARLTALCTAAARPARVVAVVPALTKDAAGLARRMGVKPEGTGTAVIAMTPSGRRQDELSRVAGVLPEDAVLVAVVLS